MTVNNFQNYDLVGIASAIERKEISALELTQASLDRLEKIGQPLNAAFTLDHQNALDRARSLDQQQARGAPLGLLHGIPLAHKDLIGVAHRKAHMGSSILVDYVPASHSIVNQCLENAGQVNVGSLHMAEFALSPTGFNQHHGHAMNPWNAEYAPGGSSSGSGIAVAARLVYGSVGSDTGGSIRHPASMCGITGLKPTNGLVSEPGVFPLSATLDCIGPMAQSVRDCARLLTVMTGSLKNYESALQSPIKGRVLGIPHQYFYDHLEPSVEAALINTIQTYLDLGVEIIEVDVPDMQLINQMMAKVLGYEALALHQKWLKEFPHGYADQVRARIEYGHQVSLTEYQAALSQQEALQEEFVRLCFAQCDALLLPTLQVEVPRIEQTIGEDTAEILSKLSRVTQVTKCMNYLEFPAMSLPCGFSANGLPVGFQLVGRKLQEEMLFAFGAGFQGATDWHQLMPISASQ